MTQRLPSFDHYVNPLDGEPDGWVVWNFDRLSPVIRLKIVSLPPSFCTDSQSIEIVGRGVMPLTDNRVADIKLLR